MRYMRLIPRLSDTSANDIKQLALDGQWTLSDLATATDETPFEVVWLTPDRQTAIHYIDDRIVSFPYFYVQGDDPNGVSDQIKAHLDVYEWGEIQDMVSEAVDSASLARALFHVGVAAPQAFDPMIFGILVYALSHSNADIRQAALIAVSFAAWPEFREVLQRLEEGDPSPDVRSLTHLIRQGLEELSWRA
jgi:hypothetical protein